MKHKHVDMITAKANNMSLVVFANDIDSDGWFELNHFPMWDEEHDYFLCLPQHKEACLHWLSGGAVQYFFDGEWIECRDAIFSNFEWDAGHIFTDEKTTYRIKPHKEKRWIAVLPNGRVSGWHDEGIEMLEEQYNKDAGWQFIEIEVEV
ncbi:hypothetical protein NVP1029O_56 [Vibrio phage 1.029.O._10N.261.55.A7]|nr:hypothetical protein NVP1029O_56 [Vibrio phage 1.029.O._10N.261.55.A7]